MVEVEKKLPILEIGSPEYHIDLYRQSLSLANLSSNPEERTEEINQLYKTGRELFLELFPDELAEFVVEGQETISSKYKNSQTEQNRTIVSMLSVVLVTPKDESDIVVDENDPRYQMFTHFQKGNKLSVESFNHMKKYAFKSCPDEKRLRTLVTILSFHDITKLKTVSEAVTEKTGVVSIDHDRLLAVAMEDEDLIQQISPAFASLSEEEREIAQKVIGSAFNRSQFAQAEATPAHLKFVSPLMVSDEVVWLQRLENMCDLAGVTGFAPGHIINEDVYRHYGIADDAVEAMRSGKKTYLGAYLDLLQGRLDMFGITDEAGERIELKEEDFFNENGQETIILLRFACMLRMSTQKEFHILGKAYERLGEDVKKTLLDVFSRTGEDDRLPVLFYYSPALLTGIWGNEKKWDTKNGSMFGIEKGLRLLSRIAKITDDYLKGLGVDDQDLYMIENQGKTTPVSFGQVKEERGIVRRGSTVEYIMALTEIVKQIEKEIRVTPISNEEAIVSFSD